jgi:membrane protein implicated in regulation of membrane protease activity
MGVIEYFQGIGRLTPEILITAMGVFWFLLAALLLGIVLCALAWALRTLGTLMYIILYERITGRKHKVYSGLYAGWKGGVRKCKE